MTDEVPVPGKAGVTESGMKIAEGQHTPYQVKTKVPPFFSFPPPPLTLFDVNDLPSFALSLM